jgi:acyl carrier protein
VLEILADVTGKPEEELTPGLDLVADLELDSAQVMELLAEVEDEFDVEIPEVEAAKLKTVQDVLDYVSSKSGAA